LQDFFRLRKRAKNLHPEPEKGSTGFEIVTLETVRATTRVWIRARFQLPREESSSVAHREMSTKRSSSPEEDDDADEDGRKKNATQYFTASFYRSSFTSQLPTWYLPTNLVFSFSQFCQVAGLAIIH
jgi:hypothetical protein